MFSPKARACKLKRILMRYAGYNLRRGFTLVEITIMLAMIGLIVAIVVPNFLKARARSQAKTCIENLRMINYASDQFAMEKGKKPGTACSLRADLTPYLKMNSPGELPKCPAGGIYSDRVIIGSNPVCSLGTLVTPAHVLPSR